MQFYLRPGGALIKANPGQDELLEGFLGDRGLVRQGGTGLSGVAVPAHGTTAPSKVERSGRESG